MPSDDMKRLISITAFLSAAEDEADFNCYDCSKIKAALEQFERLIKETEATEGPPVPPGIWTRMKGKNL